MSAFQAWCAPAGMVPPATQTEANRDVRFRRGADRTLQPGVRRDDHARSEQPGCDVPVRRRQPAPDGSSLRRYRFRHRMPGRSELVWSSFHFRSPSSASNRDCRNGIRISDVVRDRSLLQCMARQSRAGAPASFVILGIGRISVHQSQGLGPVRSGRVRGADWRSGPRRADRAICHLRHCKRGQSDDLGEHRSFVHGTSRWNTGAALDQGCIGSRADRHKRDVGCFSDWRAPTLVTRGRGRSDWTHNCVRHAAICRASTERGPGTVRDSEPTGQDRFGERKVTLTNAQATHAVRPVSRGCSPSCSRVECRRAVHECLDVAQPHHREQSTWPSFRDRLPTCGYGVLEDGRLVPSVEERQSGSSLRRGRDRRRFTRSPVR